MGQGQPPSIRQSGDGGGTTKAPKAGGGAVGDEGGAHNKGGPPGEVRAPWDLWELFVKQLEEMKGLQQAASVIRFAMDKLVSWMEEGSGSSNDRVRSI